MNILDKCQLTDDEADLCCQVINYFGEGSHPPADEASVYFFTPNYAIECLEKALEAGHDDAAKVKAAQDLKAKLEAHQQVQEAAFQAFKTSLNTTTAKGAHA